MACGIYLLTDDNNEELLICGCCCCCWCKSCCYPADLVVKWDYDVMIFDTWGKRHLPQSWPSCTKCQNITVNNVWIDRWLIDGYLGHFVKTAVAWCFVSTLRKFFTAACDRWCTVCCSLASDNCCNVLNCCSSITYTGSVCLLLIASLCLRVCHFASTYIPLIFQICIY